MRNIAKSYIRVASSESTTRTPIDNNILFTNAEAITLTKIIKFKIVRLKSDKLKF